MRIVATALAFVLSVTSVFAAPVLPPVGVKFDYQIGGAYTPPSGVKIVSRDKSAAIAAGLYNICYINAFQTQASEANFWLNSYPTLVLRGSNGQPIEDPGWPGEYILDTSTSAKRSLILTIVDGWMNTCVQKGFRAIEPDNLDSYERSQGRLTQANNVEMAKLLITRAHLKNLAIAQKNVAGFPKVPFDFAIVEECEVYTECDYFTRQYGRRVIEIEYNDNPMAAFTRACKLRGRVISVVMRDRDVQPRGSSGYFFRTC